MKRRLAVLLALAMLLTAAAGCVKRAPVEAGPKMLTIACCQNYTYDTQFRDFIEAGFPDWSVRFVPMQPDNDYKDYDDKSMSEFLDREKPDLLILSTLDFDLLRKANKLQNLEEWAARKKTKLTDTVTPGVLDFLRGEDDGALYAIGPSFHTSAMYYNKNIFDRLGIPYPTDGMNWEQTVELADRIMQDKRREEGEVGLHIPWMRSPFDLLQRIADTEGLTYANAKTGAVTFDSPAWERLFKQVTAAYKRGTFKASWPEAREEGGTTYYDKEAMESVDLFKQGKAALTVDSDNLLLNLKSEAKPKFEWGVVTVPSRSSDPTRGGEIQLYQMMAIPTSAGHAEEAWEVLAYFMSERVGQAKAGLGSMGAFDLSVQKNYPEWKQDADFKPFYALRPTNSIDKFYYGVAQGPADFDVAFGELVDEHIRRVLEDKETADAAFAAIQPAAEALMAKALAAAAKKTNNAAGASG